ncbi:MAG: UTP--glucose-1-phosphate uridylyltransferase [Bdellovibrionales bacterium]|nr:UTP--glucose-1-phosphate uridylyltransferase [Bdellovibrionales bacterium]
MAVKTAVIPVAGRGTRFLPVTRAVAKELLPLVDTPIIQLIVGEAVRSGIEKVILVTSKGKAAIEDYFDAPESQEFLRGATVVSVRQETPRGLGHAVWCAKPLLDPGEPFAVLLGDDVIDSDPPCIGQLMAVHDAHAGSPVVGVMEVRQEDTSKYGIVGGTPVNTRTLLVNRLVEKPRPEQAPSRLAIPGRYILPYEIIRILENAAPGVNGEIQLTDALQTLANQRKFYAHQFQGRRFDAGDRFGYLEANIHFALQREDIAEKTKSLIRALSKELSP